MIALELIFSDVNNTKINVYIYLIADKNRGPVKAWGQSGVPNSDTDSANGSSSNKSHDSSPSNSPHTITRPQLVTSHSLDELVEEESKMGNSGKQISTWFYCSKLKRRVLSYYLFKI